MLNTEQPDALRVKFNEKALISANLNLNVSRRELSVMLLLDLI